MSIFRDDENSMNARKLAMKPIIARLKRLEVKNIIMHYDGCGDSGSIDSDDIKLDIGQGNELEGDGLLPEEKTTIVDYGYALLERQHGGWEINEGSTGDITIDLNKNKVMLHHGQHITDTRYENSEFDL